MIARINLYQGNNLQTTGTCGMYVHIASVYVPHEPSCCSTSGERQHLIVGIISGQHCVKVSVIAACMWHILVMYSVNLQLLLCIYNMHGKINTVVNTVLMY